EGEVDGELVGCRAVEERPGHGLAVEGVVGNPVLGFLDHRTLADGLLAVALNRDNVGRVHRVHHVEVLALSTELHKLACDCSKTHGCLQSVECFSVTRGSGARCRASKPTTTTHAS